MINLKEIKKKVNEDWQKAFPQLTMYARNKFYKTVGPLVVGIELIDIPRTEDYRPHFVGYPLWENNIQECFSRPFIFIQFKNKKELQLNVTYVKHEFCFPEVIDQLMPKLPIKLDGNISLNDLLLMMDNYAKSPPLVAAPNSYLQAKIQEYKLEMQIYCGDDQQIKNTFNQIKIRNWDLTHFKQWNIDVNKWLNELEKKINHRGEFLKQVKTNMLDNKIKELKNSNLTL